MKKILCLVMILSASLSMAKEITVNITASIKNNLETKTKSIIIKTKPGTEFSVPVSELSEKLRVSMKVDETKDNKAIIEAHISEFGKKRHLISNPKLTSAFGKEAKIQMVDDIKNNELEISITPTL